MKPISNPEESPRSAYARLAQLDDVGVMRELQERNDDALAVLYDRYYNAVLGVGLRVLRDRGEAEDILQNVFLEIADRVGQFDPARGTVLVWIMQCAYSRSLNRRNYLLVRRFYVNVAMSDLTEFEQGALRLYGEAPQECARFVREALALLNEQQRRTIEMVHFEGLNLKDVAVRTELSFSNTRHHYYRGMAKLREHLMSVREQFEAKNRQRVSGLGQAVQKHEQYEELCTLAMIGEVSATEMQDLRQHLSECQACREQYQEFTQFLLPQLSISSDNDTSFETGYSDADRKRLRRDFLAAAQKKGRTFSQGAIRGATVTAAPPAASSARVASPRHLYRYRWAIAASVAALLFAGGYGTHVALVQRELASMHTPVSATTAPQPGPAPSQATIDSAAAAQLRAMNEADSRTIASMQQKLSEVVADLEEAQRALKVSRASQSALQDQLNQKNGQMASLQSQSQSDAQSAADLHTQVSQLQQRLTDSQATMAANELRIRDLNEQLGTQSASLDRERQMLSAGRDVRDLMGARSLHIIDVHDANGTGKDQKSFGRIFYTEGKSLIFYAFDLDDKRVTNANYSFEAWGERLGQPSSVKSLGVLFVDDKAQRRWSLKVDDPHQLAEINSVFVTLEPHAGDRDKPQGKRILFAFLGGEANHP